MAIRSPAPSAVAKAILAACSAASIRSRPRRVTRLRCGLSGRSGRTSPPSPSCPSRVKARLTSGGLCGTLQALGDQVAQLAEILGKAANALGELFGRHRILVHGPAERDLVG